MAAKGLAGFSKTSGRFTFTFTGFQIKVFERFLLDFGRLLKTPLLSAVKPCWMKGKQSMAPCCLQFLGNLWVGTLLQDGDGDKVLHVLSLVTGHKVGCHPAHVPTFLMVGLMVGPPQGHWFLGLVCRRSHPYVVCSPAFRSP